MKYPSIKAAAAEHIVQGRVANRHVDVTDHVKWKVTLDGDESTADLKRIQHVGKTLSERAGSTEATAINRDALESEFSYSIFQATEHLPVEVLDDPSFWAYFSVEHLYDFIAWRENLSSQSATNYYDGRNWSECVPLRMYHRGRLVDPEPGLAIAIPRSTDFWRSHIIRVQNSTAPDLSKALVETQAEDRMVTDELREFAKRVNRLWMNVSMHDYSRDEARRLVASQRRQIEESSD